MVVEYATARPGELEVSANHLTKADLGAVPHTGASGNTETAKPRSPGQLWPFWLMRTRSGVTGVEFPIRAGKRIEFRFESLTQNLV